MSSRLAIQLTLASAQYLRYLPLLFVARFPNIAGFVEMSVIITIGNINLLYLNEQYRSVVYIWSFLLGANVF